MRVVVVAVSLCCLLAGAPRAFAAGPPPASDPTPSSTTPTTSTVPSGAPPTDAPTSTTTTVPRSTSTTVAPDAPASPGSPTDSASAPSAAEQTAARSAFAQLTDAQHALLRRLQDARDRLATARVSALAAADEAARTSRRLMQAQEAAAKAHSAALAAERTLDRLHVEIQDLAGAVYQHLDRTVALSEVDSATTIEMARAREYSLAPSERLISRVEQARSLERRMAAANDEAMQQSRDATQLADATDAALARQRKALGDAQLADALAIAAVTEALGSGTALLAQVADPHFGADFVTAALADAQAGQDDPAVIYGILRTPVPGAELGSPYGVRVDPMSGAISYHPGIDLEAGAGAPIHAAAAGTVVIAGDCGGYGNCVVIDHGHSVATLYAHQSKVAVAVGDVVTDGQVVGFVGSTGKSTGPHLHFEVRFHGAPVDPVPMLSS